MKSFPLVLTAAILCATGSMAAAEITWDRPLYDPGPERSEAPPADLVLPMPCGGAMAFQQITIPMDATDPLADTEVRLGQSGGSAGYLDYLRNENLRGGFTDPAGSATYFYMGRYELTEAQHKALTSFPECDFTVGPRDIIAKGSLSWFDAIDLSRKYTEWLHENREDAMPREDGQTSFVRLPTEVEWEYAARGGAAVSKGEFGAIRFPMEDPVDAYARFDSERVGPVGIKKPNPLSLFDMYGNLEEIALEPFRLNSVGEAHGQVGGLVVRGGSYQRSEEQMRSSNRTEWPFYNRRGLAQAQDSFGVRFVLSVHVGTSDTRVREIRDAWMSAFESDASDEVSAGAILSELIENEFDPVRKSNLENVLLTLTAAEERAKEATKAQLEVTLRGASTFLWQVWQATRMVDAIGEILPNTRKYLEDFRGEMEPVDIEIYEDQIAILEDRLMVQVDRRNLALEAYRQSLDFLSKTPSDRRDSAYGVVERGFEEAGNDLVIALQASLSDLEMYESQPDMDDDTLLDLANTR
jgi:hypothetical protein